MDKIEKALAKLTQKERKWVKEILSHLQTDTTRGLDVKKLKGREDIFRIRKGDIRILYRQSQGKIFVLAVGRKNEKTYQ